MEQQLGVTLVAVTARERLLVAAALSVLNGVLIGMHDPPGALEVLDLQRKFTGPHDD